MIKLGIIGQAELPKNAWMPLRFPVDLFFRQFIQEPKREAGRLLKNTVISRFFVTLKVWQKAE